MPLFISLSSQPSNTFTDIHFASLISRKSQTKLTITCICLSHAGDGVEGPAAADGADGGVGAAVYSVSQ